MGTIRRLLAMRSRVRALVLAGAMALHAMAIAPAFAAQHVALRSTDDRANDPRIDAAVLRMAKVYDSVQWEVGEIVGIVDGDTADIRIGKRRLERLRLNEIDAPERGAPWSKRSKQLLSDLIFGKEVMIAITDWDRDDRAVARIFVWSGDGKVLVDVSQQMIRQGAAWYFEKFSKDRALRGDEATARKAGLGVWSIPQEHRIPPWEWRKLSKAERDLHR